MSIVCKVPNSGVKVEWKYNSPDHTLSPTEAFQLALKIHAQYKELLSEGKSSEDAQAELKNNPTILHFASPNCFPKLFAIATNPKTSDVDIKALSDLVKLREEVNSGNVSEMVGEALALKIAAIVKSKV